MAETKEKPFNLTGVVIGVLILIIGLWLATYFSLRNEPDRGIFGDMFGALNALFSGLAFAGIIITILLQRQELALQRKELVDTRKELQKSADASSRQAEVMKITADLTAYGDLFRYYNDLAQKLRMHNEARNKAIELRKHYLARFKQVLKKSEAIEEGESLADLLEPPDIE